ncbi:hypothetical protein BS50DRAFT_63064 [Corynespora cassiicola Philippines]|uniref:Uncharacterized protein n=1 Tax=Corynespora cassiicola Philippines TaxID=1448308 RepID=A0A2T2NJJ7_CORCC|nr:hypothetical protein BS50DRAFT_63064 [Corynespora cassiicola Philippines]
MVPFQGLLDQGQSHERRRTLKWCMSAKDAQVFLALSTVLFHLPCILEGPFSIVHKDGLQVRFIQPKLLVRIRNWSCQPQSHT